MVLVPTRTRPGSAQFPPCVSLSFWYCVLFFGPRNSHNGEGSEVGTSPVTLRRAVLCVGAWTRHDRYPKHGLNALMCVHVRHESVISRVVDRILNPTLGCKDIKWSDTCLVFSAILFVQLFKCMERRKPNHVTAQHLRQRGSHICKYGPTMWYRFMQGTERTILARRLLHRES